MTTEGKFTLLVGMKPIKGYITAVLVALKTPINAVTIKARGRAISKAVDVAEILKRFEDPKFKVKTIIIGTETFSPTNIPETGKPDKFRRISSIEITLDIISKITTSALQ